MPSHSNRLFIAANNGDIGGGEVMQLHIARAAAELDLPVTVVGPQSPGDLVAASLQEGFDTVAVPGQGRRDYMRALRRWDATRQGLLWCNGLVPSLATASHSNRVVHLHRLPDTLAQKAAARLAAFGASAVVVPSRFMAQRVRRWRPDVVTLPNWTHDLGPISTPARPPSGPWRIGFLGRVGLDKGVDVLATSLLRLDEIQGRPTQLVIGGERRFVAEQPAVEAALGALGSRVSYLGWVDPAAFFAQVDLAVFPSVWPEPFGLVAAEAMAAGVPFIVSDAGALPEVAGADYPWVCRASDPDHLADLIVQVLASPQRAASVAASARTRWEAEFSPIAGRGRVRDFLIDLGLLQSGTMPTP